MVLQCSKWLSIRPKCFQISNQGTFLNSLSLFLPIRSSYIQAFLELLQNRSSKLEKLADSSV